LADFTKLDLLKQASTSICPKEPS